MNRKIAFFDIDGTLTSETDGSIPLSARKAIKKARENGHFMFINTGRCLHTIEKRFLDIGFDGIICGCGTNIYCQYNGKLLELLHVSQTHDITYEILAHARKYELDILFEGKGFVQFDTKKPLITQDGIAQYNIFINEKYEMTQNPEDENFACDKFVVWFKCKCDISSFREVSDKYFSCIDRGGNFREFVPRGYSKASGIQYVLDHSHFPIYDTYSFGDSNNDLPMLNYTRYSIAMGNSLPPSLFEQVTYVTTNSSKDGIQKALEYYGFM